MRKRFVIEKTQHYSRNRNLCNYPSKNVWTILHFIQWYAVQEGTMLEREERRGERWNHLYRWGEETMRPGRKTNSEISEEKKVIDKWWEETILSVIRINCYITEEKKQLYQWGKETVRLVRRRNSYMSEEKKQLDKWREETFISVERITKKLLRIIVAPLSERRGGKWRRILPPTPTRGSSSTWSRSLRQHKLHSQFGGLQPAFLHTSSWLI